jgi:hypothetical protein
MVDLHKNKEPEAGKSPKSNESLTALESALERSKAFKEKLKQQSAENPAEEVGESSKAEETREAEDSTSGNCHLMTKMSN